MSRTAESYKRLYEAGRVDAQSLERAVTRGLITQAECSEIVGETSAQPEAGASGTESEAN